MRRLQNTYNTVENKTTLTIGEGTNAVTAVFDACWLDDVKLYHWSHRGKGIIKNEYNETLTARIASLYGFDIDEYTRLKANNDYTVDNITSKSIAGAIHRASVPYTPIQIVKRERTPHDDCGVERLQRVKYKNKYQCERVTLNVSTNGKIVGTVTIKINTFCRPYIPTVVRIGTFWGKQDVLTMSGLPLRIWLLEELDEEIECRQEFGKTMREDPLDFRLDPNDLMYVSRKAGQIRYHYLDDGVVLELRDAGADAHQPWPVVQADGHRFRIPLDRTVDEPRRIFVIIDDVMLDHADKIWYNPWNDDFMVWDKLGERHTLKRFVCKVMGIKTENIYFAPRLNARYKQALEAGFDPNTPVGLKMARRIAHYENKLHTSNRGNMFTKPKYIRKKKVLAELDYFCTEIYDGVGIWCADLRAQSLRIPGLQDPKNDRTLRKGEVA